jgi:hypothetical protein
MSQLYCTGPALFYVGIPVSWTTVLSWINQVKQNEVTNQPVNPLQTNLDAVTAAQYSPQLTQFINSQSGRPTSQPSPLQITIQQLNTTYVPVFLGTAERPPTIEIFAEWDDIETDAGGDYTPSERLTEGQEAFIEADFTRFNEIVYEVLAARSQTDAFAGTAPGWDQVGRAISLERLIFPLWIVFPYSQKAVYGLAGQPPGYRFYQGFLASPDRLKGLGTVPRQTGLQFGAQRLVQLVESTTSLKQPLPAFTDIPLPSPPLLPVGYSQLSDLDDSVGALYDFDITGLPAPD